MLHYFRIIIIINCLQLLMALFQITSENVSVSETIIALQSNNQESDNELLFSFGIIGDPQYVTGYKSTPPEYTEGGWIIGGNGERVYSRKLSHCRVYEEVPRILKEAVTLFSSKVVTENLLFSVVLGDVIDRKASDRENKVSSMKRSGKYIESRDIVFSIIDKANSPSNYWHFCFGNNDAFGEDCRIEWVDNFIPVSIKNNPNQIISTEKIYYDFKPDPKYNYRVVILDCFEVSVLGGSNSDRKAEAIDILRKENPASLDGGDSYDIRFSKGVPYLKYQKYNGALSLAQLDWLDNILSHSELANERVIIFGHLPIHEGCCRPDSLLLNNERVLHLIAQYSCVIAYIAGHDHDGGYFHDFTTGVHHLIPPAPLECCERIVNHDDVGNDDKFTKGTAFGYINVYPNKLVLNWTGKKPNSDLFPVWPTEMLAK